MNIAIKFTIAASAMALVAACGGGGSPQVTMNSVVQPIKAASLSLSSYENKMAAINAIGPLSLIDTFGTKLANQFLHSNSFAYGNFFNDGNYAMVAHSFEYDWTAATANKKGRIYFYKFERGSWIDQTPALIDNTEGCLHPRKAIVADFNQDSRPDIFFACTGVDQPPFSGERSLMLMSNTLGKYTKIFIEASSPSYTHGASAADVNGDGYPDIAITDSGRYNGIGGIGFFLNNKNGSFTFTNTLIPSIDLRKTAYTAELIKFPGRNAYDLFLSGHSSDTQYNQEAVVALNNGFGNLTKVISFPSVSSYGLTLDIIHYNGYAYLLRTIDTNPGFYSAVAIQKVKYPEMTNSEVFYTHRGFYPKGNSTWVNWLAIYNGKIVAPDADYGLNLTP